MFKANNLQRCNLSAFLALDISKRNSDEAKLDLNKYALVQYVATQFCWCYDKMGHLTLSTEANNTRR